MQDRRNKALLRLRHADWGVDHAIRRRIGSHFGLWGGHGTPWRVRCLMRPISFWLYVAAGVVMIIASAIALPFVPLRTRRV